MKKVLIVSISLILLTLCGCSDNKTTAKDDSEAYIIVGGKPNYQRVDIDLSSMSGTVAYSQVYNMLTTPENYENKVVKMKGTFSIYQNQDKTIIYPAVIIKDATACCSQGLEFVLYGRAKYPKDYPELSKEITVIGIYTIYYEGSTRYTHLVDSVIL